MRKISVSNERGMVLMISLVVMIIGTLIATTVYMSARSGVRTTQWQIKRTTAEYVAESAYNWAFSVVSQPPSFTWSTHDPSGDPLVSAEDGIPDCSNGPDDCSVISPCHLSFRPYSGQAPRYDESSGKTYLWVCQSTEDSSVSLSGASREKLAFRIWYPDAETIRIEAIGIVNDDTAEVVMRGALDLLSRYIILSDGDLAPVLRKSITINGPIHANGNVYLGSGENNEVIQTTGLTASGQVISSSHMYKPMGRAKWNYIQATRDGSYPSAGRFPWIQTIETMWEDHDLNSVEINGKTVVPSDDDDWSKNFDGIVEEGVEKIAMPSLDFKPMAGASDTTCVSCAVPMVHYSNLPDPSAIEIEWIYNPQYGAPRENGKLYTGRFTRGALSSGYPLNKNAHAAQAGSIDSGTYREAGTQPNRTIHYIKNRCNASSYDEFESLKRYLNLNSTDCIRDRLEYEWWGGAYAGEWVKARWLNLSNPDNYPKRCQSTGGVLDFGDENVIIVRASKLLYPITVYTRGEIYVIGDFNVGAPYYTWNGDTSSANFDIPDSLNDTTSSIKRTALIADGNRIWYLSNSFLWMPYGYNLGTGQADIKANRNGLRGEDKYQDVCMTWDPTRSYHDAGGDRYYNAATYVGIFMTGSPVIDQAFYVSSRSHDHTGIMTPTNFERSRNYNNPGTGKTCVGSMNLRGAQIWLNNAELESDWDAASGSFSETLADAMPGRLGDGYPPRPGKIAPRYGRGYTSYYFVWAVAQLPNPPGIGNMLARRSVYKK